jgi:hypothetical protein
MARQRQRACLQQGLKLDLNRLAQQGLVKPGAQTGPFAIRWTNSYWQEEIASGLISADMQGETEGSLRIQIGELDQTIILVASRRHYGGGQWYFMCPVTNHRACADWAGGWVSVVNAMVPGVGRGRLMRGTRSFGQARGVTGCSSPDFFRVDKATSCMASKFSKM